MRRLALLALITLALAPTARAAHVESHIGPGEPMRDFPTGFLTDDLLDTQRNATTLTPAWQDGHVGGWGSATCSSDPNRTPRRPVIFVHGTTEDAWFWRANESGSTIVNVRQRFIDDGYCPRELWAISYTGARGYFTYNDINAEEVFQFVAEVRRYLGVNKVDVVSHSLGVTVIRKAAFLHPKLYRWIANVVPIAGANHGTTTCRGLGTIHFSHVCEETEPGSAWLAELNGDDETPRGPRYLVICDCSGMADNFYLGPDDALSPELAGACNLHMPFVAHNTLARGLAAVQKYMSFLGGASCADVGGTQG